MCCTHHHHRHEITTQNSLDTNYRGPLIPPTSPEHKFRTLVLCFDGTGDQFDSDNSNIVQLFSMLSKGDPDRQMVYYQAGIGTYTIPQIATPFYANLSKTIDMMLATNLNHHVMGGYEFLMEHCEFPLNLRPRYLSSWPTNRQKRRQNLCLRVF